MADQRGTPAAGAHGGDAAHVAAALGLDPASMIDLSASLNPFAPDIRELAVGELAMDRGALTRYPDASESTRVLADAIGVREDLLVLTNGGAEAIALVADIVQNGNVVEPEFSLYRRHLSQVDGHWPRWRSNPSNPLGQLAGAHDDAGVWDEAFYPIATGEWTRGDERSWRLGSLTKLWSCPGLRLGYVVAPDAHAAERIRQRQPSWAVNGLALALLPELLARTDLPGWCAQIGALRSAFTDALSTLGYTVRPTVVNWVLVDQPGLREALAPHGVVVRDCASFGLPGTYRVALAPPSQLDRVLEAFEKATSSR